MKHSMRALLVTMVLIAPLMSVFAQGDWQAYTSDDGVLSFSYPPGWFVGMSEDGSTGVGSSEALAAGEPHLFGEAFASGDAQCLISLVQGATEEGENFPFPTDAPLLFELGYYTSLMWFASIFVSVDGTTELPDMTYENVQELTVGEYEAAFVDVYFLNDGMLGLIDVGDDYPLGITCGTAPGELEAQRETFMQIVQSIVYQP